jgi:hypothetical protein
MEFYAAKVMVFWKIATAQKNRLVRQAPHVIPHSPFSIPPFPSLSNDLNPDLRGICRQNNHIHTRGQVVGQP